MKFVLTLVLFAITSPVFCEPSTKPATTTKPLSDTVHALRKIEIVGDTPKPFESYVNHIASDLGMQILGAPSPDTGIQLLKCSTDGNHIALEVILVDKGLFGTPPTELSPAAKEFLDGIIDRVQKEMQQEYDDRRDRQLNLRAKEAERIYRDRDAAATELEEAREQLRKNTGRLDITPNNLREAMSKLQDEHQQLELDLRGKEARAEATAKAIADLTKEANAKNNEDNVLAELQQVVDAREKQLELMKKNSAAGVNTPIEVQQVAAQAAEARAKVAERKRDAFAAAGGETLGALNRELRMLSIDRAEQEVRYKLVSGQLAQIGGVSDLIDKYERALSAYPKLMDRDQQAQSSFRESQMRLDQMQKPSLQVTYSRDWKSSEFAEPGSDAKDSAHPSTKE